MTHTPNALEEVEIFLKEIEKLRYAKTKMLSCSALTTLRAYMAAQANATKQEG